MDAYKHVEGNQYKSPKSSTSRVIHIIHTKNYSGKMSAYEVLKNFVINILPDMISVF